MLWSIQADRGQGGATRGVRPSPRQPGLLGAKRVFVSREPREWSQPSAGGAHTTKFLTWFARSSKPRLLPGQSRSPGQQTPARPRLGRRATRRPRRLGPSPRQTAGRPSSASQQRHRPGSRARPEARARGASHPTSRPGPRRHRGRPRRRSRRPRDRPLRQASSAGQDETGPGRCLGPSSREAGTPSFGREWRSGNPRHSQLKPGPRRARWRWAQATQRSIGQGGSRERATRTRQLEGRALRPPP